jgi:renalase
MTDSDQNPGMQVLIIGAGMAGLAAATELQLRGQPVLVIDKGRGVGGRLASRRIGTATFDHGAQFMTARSPRFAAAVDQWLKLGLLQEWFRGSANAHPRWRGQPAMTAVPKHLAANLNVLLEKKVVSLGRGPAGWLAVLESGESIQAGAVILTPPVPQSLALLDAGRFELVAEIRIRLEAIQYERCIAVMALLEAHAQIPDPGGLAPGEGPISWIADNQLKGISAAPAVTIHATPAFSLENWERDRQEIAQQLLQAAAPWLGSRVSAFQVHAWRYARPVQSDEAACLILNQSPPLLLAGDAFAGPPRVEAAALSGWAAADALREMSA